MLTVVSEVGCSQSDTAFFGGFLCFVAPSLYFTDRSWILARILASLGFVILICLGDTVLANTTVLCSNYNYHLSVTLPPILYF